MKNCILVFLAITIVYFPRSVFSEKQLDLETDYTTNANINDSVNLQAKFLSLFTIVRFVNSDCTASNGYNGTCYTSTECTKHGGTGFGSCASGFGVCCVVTISSCGSSVQVNSTYWTNPDFNKTYSDAGLCSLYVTRNSPDICQIRLDFIEFDIAQPDSTSSSTAGQCLTDVFIVNGQTNSVPVICGLNTNQHMYLNMASGQNTISLNMILSGSTIARKWNIRTIQIPCGTNYMAIDNCLQYFTEATGTITSFNYQYVSTPVIQHLANQDYAVCIRANSGFCGVKYEACANTGGEPAFALSGEGVDGATTSQTAITDGSCTTDWLQIPCASDRINSAYLSTSTAAALQPCVTRLCGVYLNTLGENALVTANSPVYSYSRPFELRFHTDSGEQSVTTADGVVAKSTESYGFCLQYTQQACISNIYG